MSSSCVRKRFGDYVALRFARKWGRPDALTPPCRADSGGIHLKNINGSASAHIDSGGIEAAEMAGSIDAEGDSGGIRLAQTRPALIRARARLWGITLSPRLAEDTTSALSQRAVAVARENIRVTQDNLKLTRQRFEAGVADNLEIVQSQESVAGAELDYINSVFGHNLAKLSLARAVGQAAGNLAQFLNIQPGLKN